MSNLREECGVFGVYSPETCDVARTVYYGLFALQHRGQESCGIVVNDCGVALYPQYAAAAYSVKISNYVALFCHNFGYVSI